jgi:ABC-type dipeptide/oligopeptide/nickel transport system permease subunit
MVAGAWYVTGAMLAVFAGAMVPHPGGALGQLTDQFTPAFVESFVTVASILFTVALTSIVAGGA